MLRKDSIDFGFITHEVRQVCFLQPRHPSKPKGPIGLYRDTGPNTKEARLSVQRLKTRENSVLVNTHGETQS